MIDLLFLCHGRIEFTHASLNALFENTDWSLVNGIVIYNDSATDHPTTYNALREAQVLWPDLPIELRDTNLGSPVSVMKHFLARSQTKMFAKIDNDIIVPPGWLNTLKAVMDYSPDLELLGAEPGMSGTTPSEMPLAPGELHGWHGATHIGGVGLMRRSAFDTRPPLEANGRFGFTEWQHDHEPLLGWVRPDIRLFALDRLPIQPWLSLTDRYVKQGLNRKWLPYSPASHDYWDWWLP